MPGCSAARDFEPKEENPMLGFRGASRYAHPAYADGFALECAALKRVREEMGLTNVKLMVPFCRRVDEARRVHRRHGGARPEARRERARDLRHVRDPQQRDPDRRLRRAVRRLLDRLQRPDPARRSASTAIPRSSPSISTSAIPGMLEMLRLAVDGRQAQRPPCRHLRRGAGELSRDRALPGRARASIRSASTRRACWRP